MRTAAAIFVILALAACQREKRDIHVGRDKRAVPALTYRESDLIPGGRPPLEIGRGGNAGGVSPYEGNAYAISEGEKLFVNYNCSGCHSLGGGGIGPALMDRNWIYGESPEQIFQSIARGRPNGMPAWGTRVPVFQIWQLVAYVRAMGGLEPKSAKGARSDSLSTSTPRPRRPAEDVLQ